MKTFLKPRKKTRQTPISPTPDQDETSIIMEGVIAPRSFRIHETSNHELIYQAELISGHRERKTLIFDSNTKVPGLSAEELDVLRRNPIHTSFMLEGKKVLIKGVVNNHESSVIYVRTFLTLSETPHILN